MDFHLGAPLRLVVTTVDPGTLNLWQFRFLIEVGFPFVCFNE